MNVIAKKKEQVEGTFGIILSNSCDCNPDRSKIALAVKWLKKNYRFYDSFISLGERIDFYYDHSEVRDGGSVEGRIKMVSKKMFIFMNQKQKLNYFL
jgi:hypothetical protein